jgi:hypothetical protein
VVLGCLGSAAICAFHLRGESNEHQSIKLSLGGMAIQLTAVAPKRASVPVLIAANVIPLAGVMFWGWRVEEVVFLYWCENVVAGLCNLVAIVGCDPGPDRKGRPSGWFDKIFTAVFFVAHYGAFCAAHALLLAFFFFGPQATEADALLDILRARLSDLVTLASLCALFASHGWSLYRDFAAGEFNGIDLNRLMARPYPRIVTTHIFILAGGVVVMKMAGTLVPIVVFVAVKTAFDLYFVSHAQPLRRAVRPAR